ncbi:hypothetical protein GUJ93_ZPchr0002g25535 [Zizania palustris]|uniref:Uncharacterized protein n=1 Tax=Zizania palustris TaxID=103762 RepID=A0A8J5SE07_ZIZPA|nr:hypothetical protein GUJ93_ZPchr0002g26516 [Zizania palustris]KAG8060670.1 hypothetical protein GUJ93_ZPchr0002g25535 [Zizania palustris]
MEQQLLEVTRALGVIQAQNVVIQAKVESLEEIKPSVMDLATWRPEIVKSVEDLRDDMVALRTQVVQIARNPVLQVKPSDLPPILPRPTSVKSNEVKEEDDRREDSTFREKVWGMILLCTFLQE